MDDNNKKLIIIIIIINILFLLTNESMYNWNLKLQKVVSSFKTLQ